MGRLKNLLPIGGTEVSENKDLEGGKEMSRGGNVYVCDRLWLVHRLLNLTSNIATTKGRSGGTMTGTNQEAAMPDQRTESFCNYHFKVWQVTCRL